MGTKTLPGDPGLPPGVGGHEHIKRWPVDADEEPTSRMLLTDLREYLCVNFGTHSERRLTSAQIACHNKLCRRWDCEGWRIEAKE